MPHPEMILAEPAKIIMPQREMRGYTDEVGLRDAMDTREMDNPAREVRWSRMEATQHPQTTR